MSLLLKPIYAWYRNAIRHPKYRWWIIGGTLIYVLSPVDVVPDFFPIVGEIDDAVVVTILVSELSQELLDRKRAAKKKASAQAPGAAAPDSVEVKSVSVE